MAELCSCTEQYKNSGQPTCLGQAIGATRRLIMVPRYANDGTLNKIELPETLDSAFFTALLNNADRSLRWYPLPKFVNVEMPKGENIYEEFSDKSKKLVAEGVRTLKAVFPGMQPQYLNVLKSGNCTDMAAFLVDKNSSLVGSSNGEANVIYPFALNPGTISAILAWATDTTGTNVNFDMEFDADMKDEHIVKIDGGNIGINLLNIVGLYDINMEIVSTGQTAMVVKLSTEYGDLVNPIVDQGLVITDFFSAIGGTASRLYNVTDSAPITITSVVESPAGTYTFAYASQTVGKVIRVTPVKTGRDYTNVIAMSGTVA